MRTTHCHQLRRARGFSLVETTIAVGIAATVLVALVGLVPVSLETMREAGNTTAEARIFQSITSDFRMRKWADVQRQQDDNRPVDFYFDNQGTPVGRESPNAIFMARVNVREAAPLPGAAASNERLCAVEMKVTSSPQREVAFETPGRYRQSQTLLAQTDKTPAAPTVASK